VSGAHKEVTAAVADVIETALLGAWLRLGDLLEAPGFPDAERHETAVALSLVAEAVTLIYRVEDLESFRKLNDDQRKAAVPAPVARWRQQ
jgi:hypothetical protein